MLRSSSVATTLFALGLVLAEPALAQGEIVITQAKALVGNVTPGDTAGFPVSLTQRGTYKFASTVVVSANGAGVAVLAPEVTIDLNGFTLHGNGVAFHGIVGGQPNVTIRNGTITDFQYDGISLTGEFLTVADMRVVENGRRGVSSADGLRVIDSTVSRNGMVGVYCGISCHIEGNSITSNGSGITILTGLVIGNTITDNTGTGIHNAIAGGAGFGHNFLRGNNGTGNEVSPDLVPLSPNACVPACP